jgi:hypothetical protein
MGFTPKTNLVRNGESVSAGVVNRPTRTIEENVRYLYDLIQAASIGSTIFARQVTVEEEVLVGTPVYFNDVTQRWERGLAAVATDVVTGQLYAAPSSQIWGVVYSKTNATLADILLAGYTTLDISQALADSDTASAGLYYLSGVTAGRLTRQRPPVSVPVLRSDGNGKVYVNPRFEDFLTGHVHHRFDLVAAPAGTHTPPSIGERHVITAANNNAEGWLPADDAIFAGNAPAGAVFGYNLSANAALLSAWPPLPVSNAVLEMDRGEDATQGLQGVPTGPTGLVVLDRYGIWWMSDCYGDVPWPTDLDTSVEAESESGSLSAECPRELSMALVLWFTKPTFLTDSTVVTSVVSDDNRLQVLCELDPTRTASTGPLLLRLNLDFLVNSLDTRSHLAMKSLTEDGEGFNFGPNLEGIYSGSSNVVITPQSGVPTSLLNPDDAGSATVYHGMVGITVIEDGDRELGVQLVRLDRVLERYLNGVMYLGFPAGEETTIRAKIQIPNTLDVVSPQLKLRLRLYSVSAGTLPQLTVTYRRIPATVLGVPVALPTAEAALTIVTTVTLPAGRYVDIESSPIAVAAGDDLFLTITREAGDAFTGELGLLRQSGIVSGGA